MWHHKGLHAIKLDLVLPGGTDDKSVPGKFRINSTLPENAQQLSCRVCDVVMPDNPNLDKNSSTDMQIFPVKRLGRSDTNYTLDIQ